VQRHEGVGGFGFDFIFVAFHETPLDENFIFQPVEVGPSETEDFAAPQTDSNPPAIPSLDTSR
jgi:hypothetical protein